MSKQEAIELLKNMSKEQAFSAGLILVWEHYHNGPLFLCQMEQRKETGGSIKNTPTVNHAHQAFLNYLEAYEQLSIHQHLQRDLPEKGWYTQRPDDILDTLQTLNDMIEPGSDESQGLTEEQQLALADVRTLLQRFAIPELKKIFSK